MRKLWLTLLLSLCIGPSAFGASRAEYCLSDAGICVLLRFNDDSRLTQVMMKRPDWDRFGPGGWEMISRVQASGTYVNTVSEDHYNSEKINLPTITYEYARIASGLSDIPNEQWDAWMGTAACVGTAAACGAAGGTTFASLGATVFWTGLWCGTAALTCVDALRKWEIWEKAQATRARAEREAAASAQGGGGGTGEPRTPTPATNPIPFPLTPTVTINPGSVSVSETPPGGGPPRPIRPPVVKPRT